MEPSWTPAARTHRDEDGPSREEPLAEESSRDQLGRLDIDLDRKSRRHNLTAGNVRDILHEVITDERVVAMMKAAIRDTRDTPMFEPKMTRSRWKTAVRQGQCVDWSLSAEQSWQPPQFADIQLDADEDSSDEEYRPQEEEDDTAEESFLSDCDVIWPPEDQTPASGCRPTDDDAAAPSFLESLNAVEEELDRGPAYATFSSLGMEEEDGGGGGSLALRTRSKLPLVDVPLERLEAELPAPDGAADADEVGGGEEDRHWTRWLHGLVATHHEEEADDDDDPEYNVLDDLDEPDLEDYRTDRGVQITKKEVNQLLEELFLTLRDGEGGPEEEEEEEDEEDEEEGEERPSEARSPVERKRAARQSCHAVQPPPPEQQPQQQRPALRDATNWPATSVWLAGARPPALRLDSAHKARLGQQMQQHVQLLTQVHLLSRDVGALKHEASVTKHFLEELRRFAARREQLSRSSAFRASNLQEALELLEESRHATQLPPRQPPASGRWLPAMSSTTAGHAFPVLPADAAWLLATRGVFLYPQLLPVCSLDPARHARPHRGTFTAGEDGLMVLGLKHFEGAVQPQHLMATYLLCKSAFRLAKHIREMSGPRAPPRNILKMFLTRQPATPRPLDCEPAGAPDRRPPVEKDPSVMPLWLQNSREAVRRTRRDGGGGAPCYPGSLPRGCHLKLYPSRLQKGPQRPAPSRRRLFTLAHNASLHPICPARPQGDALFSSPVCAGGILLVGGDAAVSPPVGPTESPTRRRPRGVEEEERAGADSGEGEPAGGPDGRGREEERAGEGEETPGADRGEEERAGEGEETPGADRGEERRAAGHEDQGRPEERAGGGREGEREGQREGQREGEGEQEGEQEGEREGEREGQRAGEEEGEEEKDEEDDDDDEDFDELTQDEDFDEEEEEEEEEEASSEESLPPAAEAPPRSPICPPRACPNPREKAPGRSRGPSEEEHSPGSPDDEEEEEEEAPKRDGGAAVASEDDDPAAAARQEGRLRKPPRGGAARGRGRRSPGDGAARRARREPPGKAPAGPPYDGDAPEKDPRRQSKDAAYAHGYLRRVREALRDRPDKLEDFVRALNQLERPDGRQVLGVFRKLRGILGKRTELLRDFAAFLHPEQALECGLFEEQQAFERSRRFLRRLEVTFGDNPSHYNKIIKALQPGPRLGVAAVRELQAQMAALLKGHPRLQEEFWVFFDELRPPPARPGQFEEARWPEEGEEGPGLPTAAAAGFEEVTLPDEDAGETDASLSRHRMRKLRSRAAPDEAAADCAFPSSPFSSRGSHWLRRRPHRRRGCARVRGGNVQDSPGTAGVSANSDPLHVPASRDGAGLSDGPARRRSADEEETGSPSPKRKRDEDVPAPAELPVCAKNISLTPSGEKVILWTREADRVILTTCRREGANPDTFRGISALLGNKTAGEVSGRFGDLMRLFQSAARQAGCGDQPPTL
ncbi:GON-4-like protein [Stigmatopora nigra]